MYWGPKKVDIERCVLRGMRLVAKKDRIRNEHIRFTNELYQQKEKNQGTSFEMVWHIHRR